MHSVKGNTSFTGLLLGLYVKNTYHSSLAHSHSLVTINSFPFHSQLGPYGGRMDYLEGSPQAEG